MFGVVNCDIIVLSVGYLALILALPLEEKQRNTEPVTYEVIQQGAPCGTGANIDDDVKLTIVTYIEVGDGVVRGPQLTIQINLGDSHIPGMDEGLVGMCPGEIRRLISPSSGNINGRHFSDYYDVELVGLGVKNTVIPPEIDTDGDNVLNRQELANYMTRVLGQKVSVERIWGIFDEMDKNGNGVLEFNEMQLRR